MYACEFCKSEFSTTKALKQHQKIAKYCLLQRGEDNTIYKCDTCGKVISTKHRLKTHKETCVQHREQTLISKYETLIEEHKIINKNLQENHEKQINMIQEKYENQINILQEKHEKQIKELQDRLENLATKAISRPTTTNNTCTTNNTNIMNLAPLDMDILTNRITKVINEKMTSSHLIDGQEGVARLVASCFTNEDGKKLITCTDTSRGIWKSKDKDGNIIKDYKANTIAKVVKPIAVSKADKIIELDDDKRSKLNELKEIKERYEKYDSLNEKDESHMKGHKKDSLTYKSMVEHIAKRRQQYLKDREREEEIGREYDFSSFFIAEEDADMKMRAGKVELKMMGVDSTKFSNGLLTRIN